MASVFKILNLIFSVFFNTINKTLNLFNPCLYAKRFRVVDKVKGQKQYKSRLWAILVIYQKKEIPFYVKNIIRVLNNLSINILISANDSITAKELNYLSANCNKLLIRKNFGRDFAAYKDALTFLDLKSTDKLLMLNDSIAYFKKNLQKTIAQFIKKEFDIISLYKSYAKKNHYQSFLLSFSNNVLNDKKFTNFWKSYIPFNNRTHAINNGEIRFSTKVLNLYSNSYVINQFRDSAICTKFKSNEWQQLIPDGDKTFYNNIIKDINLNYYLSENFFHNPTHKFAFLSYFINKSLILKNDIYFRGTYSIISISLNLNLLGIDKFEIREFIKILDTQLHFSHLNFYNRYLSKLGLI